MCYLLRIQQYPVNTTYNNYLDINQNEEDLKLLKAHFLFSYFTLYYTTSKPFKTTNRIKKQFYFEYTPSTWTEKI